MKRVQNFLLVDDVDSFSDSYIKVALGSNNWVNNIYKLGNLDTEIVVTPDNERILKYVGYSQNKGFPSLYRLYDVLVRLLVEADNKYDSDIAYLMAVYDDKKYDCITVEMYFLKYGMVILRFKGTFRGFKLFSMGGKDLGNFLTDLEEVDYLNFVLTDAISEIGNSVPIAINRVGLWLETPGNKYKGLSVHKGCAVGFNDYSDGEYSMVVVARK